MAAPSFRHTVHGRKWHTSMFTLFTEPGLLLSSILCPCHAYHEASASFEKDPADWCESACGGVCFFCGFDLRSRFREKYELRGNEGQDFCIHCWCNCCGLAQIRREAKLWKDSNVALASQPSHPPGSSAHDRPLIAPRPLMPQSRGGPDAHARTASVDPVSNGLPIAEAPQEMVRPRSIASESNQGTIRMTLCTNEHPDRARMCI